MSLQIKQLYRAQLGTGETNLYAPGTGKAAIIKSIRLVNTSDSPVTVNLLLKRGTEPGMRIIPKDLSLGPGAAFIDDSELTLEYVDSSNRDWVRGLAGAASAVDCVISGVERDV